MKTNTLQIKIRKIKNEFEKIPFCSLYDLDKVIDNLNNNDETKPNLINEKIFDIIVEYMEAHNHCLPSDLIVLQRLVGHKKGWGYLTSPMIWEVCRLQDLGWDESKNTMAVITAIVNLKVAKFGNLRFIVKNNIKRLFLNKMLDHRNEMLVYYVDLMDDELSVQHKKEFGYEKHIQEIKKQIKEIEKALQIVA